MSSSSFPQLLLRLATAACVAGMSTVSYAEAAPAFTGNSFVKSSAVLRGPSKLSQILAQQGAYSNPVALPTIRPASYSRPTIQRQIPHASNRLWTGGPDVFGSIALKVSRTPLDDRWDRVVGRRLSGTHARFARSLVHLSTYEKLQRINSYVNKRVSFTDDSIQFRADDVWATASETLRRGKGDCEDYAIAKMQLLREARISKDDLYLVLVKDLVRRSDHAVLVVRVGGRTLLLDNGTDRVIESETVVDYRPVFTFAASGTWTHGYRRSFAPQMTVASANFATLPVLAQR